MRPQLVGVAVVDRDAQEMRVGDEVRLGTRSAHVQLVADVVRRQQLGILGVALRAQEQERKDPRRASGAQARLRQGRQGTAGATVLAEHPVTARKLQQAACKQSHTSRKSPGEFGKQHGEEGVIAAGNGPRPLVVHYDLLDPLLATVRGQQLTHAHLVMLKTTLDDLGTTDVDGISDVACVELQKGPAVNHQHPCRVCAKLAGQLGSPDQGHTLVGHDVASRCPGGHRQMPPSATPSRPTTRV